MKTYGEFFTMLIKASDAVMVATPTGDIYFHPLRRHVGKTPSEVGIRVFREGVRELSGLDPSGFGRVGGLICTNEIPFAEHFHRRNSRKAV